MKTSIIPYREDAKVFLFNLINQMIRLDCYVKRFYSRVYRVIDSAHNPITNISQDEFYFLTKHLIVTQSGDKWELAVDKNPFSSSKEIIYTQKTKPHGSKEKTNRAKGDSGLRNKGKGNDAGNPTFTQLSIENPD